MRTVLVVDDDPGFLAQVENLLRDAGYQVFGAEDASQAVQVLETQREKIDLAIVDLLLPDINGFELIGAMTRRPNALKIIATSAVFDRSQLDAATAVGAHAAIQKPPPRLGLPRQQWLGTVQQLIGIP